jgi:hypothetical protein
MNSTIQKFFSKYKSILISLNLQSIPLVYSSKLNTKNSSKFFTNIFTFTTYTVQNLLSLQKIQYIGLHAVSAAR